MLLKFIQFGGKIALIILVFKCYIKKVSSWQKKKKKINSSFSRTTDNKSSIMHFPFPRCLWESIKTQNPPNWEEENSYDLVLMPHFGKIGGYACLIGSILCHEAWVITFIVQQELQLNQWAPSSLLYQNQKKHQWASHLGANFVIQNPKWYSLFS